MQERYAIEIDTLGMAKNHIHLLSSAYPRKSPGEIVRILKKYYCREIFRRYPEIKKGLWGGELINTPIEENKFVLREIGKYFIMTKRNIIKRIFYKIIGGFL